jgi:hypothetical protein
MSTKVFRSRLFFIQFGFKINRKIDPVETVRKRVLFMLHLEKKCYYSVVELIMVLPNDKAIKTELI